MAAIGRHNPYWIDMQDVMQAGNVEHPIERYMGPSSPRTHPALGLTKLFS